MQNQDKPKKCSLCDENVKYVDYKDIKTLRKFLSPYARIMHRLRTGTCAKHQRSLARAMKKSRFMGLVPYITH